MQIIETNITYGHSETIKDHQSRIIKVDSWEDYISLYNQYHGEPSGDYNGSLIGYTLPKNAHIYKLSYDDFHLQCELVLWNNDVETKLAYLVK